MKSILSNCCQSEIFTGSKREYPLGGTTYGINYIVHTCSKCEEECCEQEYNVCDYCGEVTELNAQGYCEACVIGEIV